MRATGVHSLNFPQGDNLGQQLYHARAEQLGQLGLPGRVPGLSKWRFSSEVGYATLPCTVSSMRTFPQIVKIQNRHISAICKKKAPVGKHNDRQQARIHLSASLGHVDAGHRSLIARRYRSSLPGRKVERPHSWSWGPDRRRSETWHRASTCPSSSTYALKYSIPVITYLSVKRQVT